MTNLEIGGENHKKKLTLASRHLEGWQRKSFPPRFLWSHILAQSKLDPPRPWHGLFRTPIHPEKSRFSLSSGNPRFSIFALRLRQIWRTSRMKYLKIILYFCVLPKLEPLIGVRPILRCVLCFDCFAEFYFCRITKLWPVATRQSTTTKPNEIWKVHGRSDRRRLEGGVKQLKQEPAPPGVFDRKAGHVQRLQVSWLHVPLWNLSRIVILSLQFGSIFSGFL